MPPATTHESATSPRTERSRAALACDFIHNTDGNDVDHFVDVPSSMTDAEYRAKIGPWAHGVVESAAVVWEPPLTNPERDTLRMILEDISELALAGHFEVARERWQKVFDGRPMPGTLGPAYRAA